MEENTEKVSRESTMYEDILLERRGTSDLRWAAREWEESVKYNHKKTYSESEIYNTILNSDRVTAAMKQLAAEGTGRGLLVKRVFLILKDMNHCLDIGMIRRFGLILPKIMKRIYNKILVSIRGINMLKDVISETPVLFLPTHRSYADFLLISYIAFHYHLPVPVIAAGMDFMSMAVVGDMLRAAGAFYIRRSFMDDKLYWAVFQEYVQFLICSYGQPIEFFLEGTRSRSGKSLPPKLGLLGCVVECWLRGRLPDIAIVPISISYNRTLEEKLYAYEMLGVPKPKESTSGLLKAMKILKESFGNIYVHFGTPVSVSKFMSARVDRHLFTAPYHLTSLSKHEFEACEHLSLHVLRRLQTECVVSVWSLACITFLRTLWMGGWSVPYQVLSRETLYIANLVRESGALLEGSDSEELLEDHLIRSLKDHVQTAELTPDGVIHIKLVHEETANAKSPKAKGISLHPSTISASVTHLMLQYYVNQTLHVFVRSSLVSLALKSRKEVLIPLDYLLSRYTLLTNIFADDFIFEPGRERQDMMDSLRFLSDRGCLILRENDVQMTNKNRGPSMYTCDKKYLVEFFIELLHPFILNYQAALSIASTKMWESESSFIYSLQLHVETSVRENLLYSSLSHDTCRHALKMLLKMGALFKEKSSCDEPRFIPDYEKIAFIKEVLNPSLIVSDQLQPRL